MYALPSWVPGTREGALMVGDERLRRQRPVWFDQGSGLRFVSNLGTDEQDGVNPTRRAGCAMCTIVFDAGA